MTRKKRNIYSYRKVHTSREKKILGSPLISSRSGTINQKGAFQYDKPSALMRYSD